jgi:peptidyl-prolyl cis-trans isomerase C
MRFHGFTTTTTITATMFLVSLPGLALAQGAPAPTPPPERRAQVPAPAQAQAPAQASAEATTGPSEFPDVVARVNGSDITKKELLTRAEALRNQMPALEIGADFYQRVLADMVSGELLYQSVEKKGLAPSDQEVDVELQSQKARLGGDAELQKALESQGITLDELRSELRKEIAIQNLVEKQFLPTITVSDEEKHKFYEENSTQMKRPPQFRVAHILIGIDAKATDEQKAEAKKKATAIHGMLEAGQDFADLAKRNSDDPGSKDNGGELPWMSPGQTVPEFEKAALALQPGQLSPVVETKFGYHIIRMNETREAGVVPYEEVQDRIDEFLKRKGLQQKIEGEIETLRAQGKVEVFI